MSPAPKPTLWQLTFVLTLGIFSVSTAAILIRLTLDAAQQRGVGISLVIAALRLTIAALILSPAWHNFQTTTFSRKAIYYAIAAGISLAAHFATWITSLSYTSIAASTTLVTTNPIWVAVLSWLWFGEIPGMITICGIGMALAGGLLIGLGDLNPLINGSNPILGDSLALLGSWAVSFYLLFGREAQRHGLGIASYIVLTYSTAAVVLLPLPLLAGASYSGYPDKVYLYVFLLGLVPQVIGHTSFNWAVRWLSPTLVTLTILAEPIGSSILGFVMFKENPGQNVIAGAVIILTGVAIAALGGRRKQNPEQE